MAVPQAPAEGPAPGAGMRAAAARRFADDEEQCRAALTAAAKVMLRETMVRIVVLVIV